MPSVERTALRRVARCAKGLCPCRQGHCVQGRGVEEKGVDKSTDKVLIEVDPPYFRSTEVDALVGDASKAGAKLGWKHKTSFDALVAEMVDADMTVAMDERLRRNRHT
jgi:GDPmannose 4,6-dehydratase